MALFDQLARQITAVRVETSVLPDIVITDPFAPGPPNVLLQRLRPKITLEIAHGEAPPIVIAPYGDPASEFDSASAVWGSAAIGALGALLFALFRRRGGGR
jgi:hypothetical protein